MRNDIIIRYHFSSQFNAYQEVTNLNRSKIVLMSQSVFFLAIGVSKQILYKQTNMVHLH